MGKRITIKDIAEKAGVSLGSAHKALSGKSGVSKETKKKVLEAAKMYDYRPNKAAAALKRKAKQIALLMPEAVGENKYYIESYWKGARDCLNLMMDYNIKIVEAPFQVDRIIDSNTMNNEIEKLLKKGKIDGVICATGYINEDNEKYIEKMIEQDITLVFLGDKIDTYKSLCCIQPNYFVIGKTAAEVIMERISNNQDIVIYAGNKKIPSHVATVEGFEEYLKENGCKNRLIKHYLEHDKDVFEKQIIEDFQNNGNIGACFAVTARSSVVLGNILKNIVMDKKVVAIGSDIFEENVQLLREKVFSNLINKNPYLQAYSATKILLDYLLRDIEPYSKEVYVGSEIIYRSSLPLYEANGENSLFFLLHS